MGLLSEMTVRYAVDLSNLTSGITQAKSSMSSVTQVAAETTAAFKQMSGAADLSRTISGVDVARANLTLLESKVTEARAKLQTLQDSADAGQAVTGIPEAEAQLTLLEAKAQDARANLQQLEAEEQQAGAAASGLAAKEDEAATATMSFGERITSAASGMKESISGFADFTSKIGMTVMGLQAMGQMAIQTASSILQPAATAETTELSFTTLLHSTKAAHDEMASLNAFAASTPMQTQWVDDASAKMLAFGFSQKDLIPDITAIGDSLSGLGKLTAPSLNSIVDIFGKIRAQGKLTGGDMMQLSDWGIPAWQALSESMHKPIPELQKMVSSGLIPADVAIKSLTGGMEKTFGGGMQKQANTFTGLMSTLASNWQIAMAALGAPVLKALEPQLSKLATALSSPAFQQFATTAGQQIGTALGNMVTGFIRLVAIGSQVVKFFQDNRAALIALEVVGIAVAGALIAVMVVGFYTWAVAAGAAAIATLAATWPILAIGAAIALLVVGIVLAVQHWGEITKFLQGIWARFTSWFMGILGAIGNFFVGIWNGIAAFFTGIWNGMVSGIQSAWAFIVNIAKMGAQLLFLAIFGPIIAIANLFIWLYQHNTYFQRLIDAIVGFVRAGIAWLQNAWTVSVNFISAQWQRLVGFAASIWNSVSAAVSNAVKVAVAFLQAQWNAASTWIQSQWSRIAGFAQTAWSAVSRVFSSIWGTYIAGPMNSLWNQFAGWFSNMAGQFSTSGSNFIQMLASAITSGSGSIWNAVVGIANTIWTALGFHSPAKAGPAHDADRWMPNLVDMLSTGLTAGIPKMQSAAIATAQPLRAFAPSSAGTAAIIAASSGGGANSGGGYGTSHTFILEVDGTQFTKQVVGPNLDKVVRLKLGAKGRIA